MGREPIITAITNIYKALTLSPESVNLFLSRLLMAFILPNLMDTLFCPILFGFSPVFITVTYLSFLQVSPFLVLRLLSPGQLLAFRAPDRSLLFVLLSLLKLIKLVFLRIRNWAFLFSFPLFSHFWLGDLTLSYGFRDRSLTMMTLKFISHATISLF